MTSFSELVKRSSWDQHTRKSPYTAKRRVAMECPKCKLINSDSAGVCDCGYNFLSGRIEMTHGQVPSASESSQRESTALGKASIGANLGLVIACGVLLAGFAVLLVSLLLKHWGL